MSAEESNELDVFDEVDDEVQENKFLMCRLGDEIYGIDIGYVTDIIELQKITEVPEMPDYVRGVINLRGNVIPVIDLRTRFKMEERDYDDRTVITVVHIKGSSIGFIVDTATEVEEISEKDIDPPPRFKENEERNSYISGLGKKGKLVIILLDIEKLIGQDEIQAITAGVQ
jgi:purine-binding chemotaxis protein CheW